MPAHTATEPLQRPSWPKHALFPGRQEHEPHPATRPATSPQTFWQPRKTPRQDFWTGLALGLILIPVCLLINFPTFYLVPLFAGLEYLILFISAVAASRWTGLGWLLALALQYRTS